MVPQPKRDKYIADTDTLILEDELQRIVLLGNIDVQRAVTGRLQSITATKNLKTFLLQTFGKLF